MKKADKIKVDFTDQETTVEVLADSIKKISEGIKVLRSGKLNERALVLLIQHASKSSYRDGRKPTNLDIKNVLNAIQDLEKTYLK